MVAKVTETICNKLIEAGLNDAGQMNENSAGKVAALLTSMALVRHSAALAPQPRGADSAPAPAPSMPRPDTATGPIPTDLNDIPWQTLAAPQRSQATPAQPVFALQFAPDMPLVGVGAPAASYYPAVAQGLGVRLVVPPHAEVANAVGAVLGQVAQRVHITVTQPVRGTFKVFTPDGPQDFRGLDAAIAQARALAGKEAHARALAAGAVDAQVVFSQEDNQVNNDIDGNVFFEATVTATAWGRPRRKVFQV